MDIRVYRKGLQKQFPEADKKVKNDLALHMANEVERNRIAQKLTQSELAKKVGTKQSGISRLERGSGMPSLTLVRKCANAMNMYVECKFRAFTQPESKSDDKATRTVFFSTNQQAKTQAVYGYVPAVLSWERSNVSVSNSFSLNGI